MRIHLVSALGVMCVGSGLALGMAEQLALLLCTFLVLAAEAANSALEALVDLVSPNHHDLARIAKDAGAAAVLLLAIGAASTLALVVLHAWPDIVRGWPGVIRQVALGVPLMVAMAVLLVPAPRPRTVDAALVAIGAALLTGMALRTHHVLFTGLAVVFFGVAVIVRLHTARAYRREAVAGVL